MVKRALLAVSLAAVAISLAHAQNLVNGDALSIPAGDNAALPGNHNPNHQAEFPG